MLGPVLASSNSVTNTCALANGAARTGNDQCVVNLCGGNGLTVAGGLAARFTGRPVWFASLRQLAFGAIAIAATYGVGSLIDTLL